MWFLHANRESHSDLVFFLIDKSADTFDHAILPDMLITFETKAYANITMFGEIAKKLIKAMGHSGTVPGAIQAKDLPKALEQLKAYLRAEMATVKDALNAIESHEKECKASGCQVCLL